MEWKDTIKIRDRIAKEAFIKSENGNHLDLTRISEILVEEYNNSSIKIDPPKPPFSGLHYQG